MTDRLEDVPPAPIINRNWASPRGLFVMPLRRFILVLSAIIGRFAPIVSLFCKVVDAVAGASPASIVVLVVPKTSFYLSR